MGLVVFWGLVLGFLGMLLAPLVRRLTRGPEPDGESCIVELEDFRHPPSDEGDGDRS